MDAWDILLALGLPEGPIRPPPKPPLDAVSLQAAFKRIARDVDALPTASQEALLAWLHAFRSHWPLRFSEALGDEGHATLARLAAIGFDANRGLKLRRIAIDNLARVL